MKKLFLVVILFNTINVVYSQGPLAKGEAQINAGVGFSSWGLPIYGGFDVAVHKDITLGGEVSFRIHDNSFSNTSYRHTIIGFLGNGNYHFNSIFKIPSPWDLYAGLNLGFYNWSSPSGYPGSGTSGLGLGAQVGGRYYFNKLGLNLEIGGGNVLSGGKFGITYKL